MACSTSKSCSIQKVARQLQQLPQNKPAVVQRAAWSVAEALQPVTQVRDTRRQRLPASTARANIIAALQSAGWLLQAARTAPLPCTAVVIAAAHQCVNAANGWLPDDIDEELLKALVQPPAGSMIPALTTWLPWAAQTVLQSMAAHPDDKLVMHMAVSLLSVWGVLLSAAAHFPNSPFPQPATWCAPPLLQLAHVVFQVPRGSAWREHIDYVIRTAVAGFTLSAHPALSTWVKGRPGDEVLGATAAEALRQDIWWHILGTATTSSRSLKQRDPTWVPVSKHPGAGWQQAVASRCCYPLQLFEPLFNRIVCSCTAEMVHVLLLTELWDVWPWQLEQLQGATSGSGSVTTSSNSGCSPTTTSASLACTEVALGLPLLPHMVDAASSSAVAPVTLQQLQLVTSILTQGHWANFYPAVLLMSLLLQRADPSLQAQFLGSPWGSYFLNILVTASTLKWFGEEPVAWRATNPRQTGDGVLYELWAAMQMHPPCYGWQALPAATSCLLALAWAHLAVEPGCDIRTATEGWAVLGTYRGAMDTQKKGSLPECLVTTRLPHTAFCFPPGLAPSLELFAAAEQLLRRHTAGSVHGLDMALDSLAVLLHAAAGVWMSGASRGHSISSNAATGCGTPRNSTTSGRRTAANSSDQHNSSRVCGPGVLKALSSLVVSTASCLLDMGSARSSRAAPRPDPLAATRSCSLIAADMMRLAAHQLQQPGAGRLGALELAAAGQRLAAACAEVASQQLSLLRGGRTEQHSSSRSESDNDDHHLEDLRERFLQLQGFKPLVPDFWQQKQSAAHATGAAAPGPSDSEAARVVEVAASSLATMHQGLLALQGVLGDGLDAGSFAGMVQRLVDVAAAAAAAGSMEPASGVSEESLSQLLQAAAGLKRACSKRVQLVGCGNPCCTNLSGPSAEGLVAGRKGVRCGGCRVARYCCPACQQADWPQHRHVCRRLGAAPLLGTA